MRLKTYRVRTYEGGDARRINEADRNLRNEAAPGTYVETICTLL
jgi:hypothetical protein